jgi:hypothetical protein
VIRCAADSTAPPATAWALLARPARWQEWAPQLRGAWGLAGSDGEVAEGARGAARLLGAVPVPARITRVDAGRLWTWRVGPVELDHVVEPRPDGCTVVTTMRAAAPLEALLRVTYAPVVRLLMGNLARVAERAAARATSP